MDLSGGHLIYRSAKATSNTVNPIIGIIRISILEQNFPIDTIEFFGNYAKLAIKAYAGNSKIILVQKDTSSGD